MATVTAIEHTAKRKRATRKPPTSAQPLRGSVGASGKLAACNDCGHEWKLRGSLSRCPVCNSRYGVAIMAQG